MTANRTDNIPYAAPVPDDIDAILRKHLNVTGDNIRLREELATARKARDAAQELLEAERQKNAALNDKLINAEEARTANATVAVKYLRKRDELRAALDTEKLLRTNDAATIADLQRQLREATSQLKAQREAVRGPFGDPVWTSKGVSQWVSTDWANAKIEWSEGQRIRLAAENAQLEKMVLAKNDEIANLDKQLKAQTPGRLKRMHELSASEVDEIRAYVPYGDRVARAENVELRRTISLMAKTAAEVQDNFRLIAELAAYPADQNRKENRK